VLLKYPLTRMANNIFIGSNSCVAKTTISFADAGITADNTEIIFCIEGVSLSSYRPTRGINPITGFEAGKGYYFIAKQDLDQSANLIPPIPDCADVTTTGGIFSAEFDPTFA